jgi:hypothetical protein
MHQRVHEVDAFVEHRHLLLARHRDRVLVRIAMDADLVPGFRHGLHLGRKRLDRVARDEPRRLDAEPGKQLQEARAADLTRKKTARAIVGGILTAVGAEPSGHGVDVDTKPHRISFAIVHLQLAHRIV